MALRERILAVLSFSLIAGAASSTVSLDGIYALAKRRVPTHAHSFSFSLSSGDADSFVISDVPQGIHVDCTTVSACARGFYTYLTQFGGTDIWWTGSRLTSLPIHLPKVGTPVKGQAIVPYRYHFNTVTFSYTTPFWTFDQWELELDWLALRGVNLPLAWNGYEYILSEIFREVGQTDADIASFLSGPAFQAWNRFGNIQGNWGGDLPTAWINDQFELQKQIVKRMKELGMTPVLPSFTGFVPRALSSLYPNASIVNGSQWAGFPAALTNVSFLEPFDPLFATMQKSFITKQNEAYGNASHIYTLDQYNENEPFSGDPAYLASISAGTFASLRAADPDAVWMMQGWLFFADSTFWTDERVEAYLGGVPGNDSMIILDLYAEAHPQWNRTASYYGKQWVWCELHGYGGNIGMEGNLDAITQGPVTALHAPGSSMKGMGLTMEGQEGDELIYDALLDQAWSAPPLDLTTYVDKWVARRYLKSPLPQAAVDAWRVLASTVYNNQDPGTQSTIKPIFELTPSLTGRANITGVRSTFIPYDTNTTVLAAARQLLQAYRQNPQLGSVPEFAYDVVDVTRQLLSNRFADSYAALVDAYGAAGATPASVSAAGALLLALIDDLDALLATNEHFLLSTWISDAKRWAHGDAAYERLLEYNARNQITLWGPDGEISDYASRSWAGVVGTYYKERWAAFVEYLVETKKNGTAYDDAVVQAKNFAIGAEWCNGTWGTGKGETWGTVGNSFEVAQRLVKKWG